MPDKQINCRDCKQPFVFTEGEQAFFEQRGFQPPKRCKACNKAKKEREAEGNR